MFEEAGTARTQLLAHLGFNVRQDENGNASNGIEKKLTSTLGLEDVGESSAFPIDNDEAFFNNIQPSVGGFSDNDAPNGKETLTEAAEHLDSSEHSVDNKIQRALVVGDYKEAVLQCISAHRMADALVIANLGGSSLWESTRDQYLKKSLSPYLKVVSAMVSNDLMGLVTTRPLDSWKETLALLCTFAQKEDWTLLCDTLASRLRTAGNTLAATLCYICAGNIDKTVEIWSCNLKSEHEGKSYVDLLQDLMEKTIVLALAIGQKRLSASLSKLVENYAELLASQGLLTTAMEYLKLLGSEELSHELSILQNRIALSAEDNGKTTKSSPYEGSLSQTESIYGAQSSNSSFIDNAQNYYQDKAQPQLQQRFMSSQYGEGYQQSLSSYGGYQPVHQKKTFQEYINPATSQQAQPQQVFVPSQAPQVPQPSFVPVVAQPALKPFVPATPPSLKNVEQYQQPTFGSQLLPGAANYMYRPVPPGAAPQGVTPSQPGPVPGHKFPQTPSPAAMPRGFTPITNPGFVQGPAVNPVQPSSPALPAQAQLVAAPPAPTPTVQTADTSNVPVEMRPVVATLTRLYNETSEALGGVHANPSKKREIEDNSKKIGSLFAKLNRGDLSPNAASKLRQLCQALDASDFASALHTQVLLTTSDWDECNFWLAALKRMIKTKQSSGRL